MVKNRETFVVSWISCNFAQIKVCENKTTITSFVHNVLSAETSCGVQERKSLGLTGFDSGTEWYVSMQ